MVQYTANNKICILIIVSYKSTVAIDFTSTEPTPMCPAGSFSSSGYEPCTLCEIGSYQDEAGHTNCNRCPFGSSTEEEGAPTSGLCNG